MKWQISKQQCIIFISCLVFQPPEWWAHSEWGQRCIVCRQFGTKPLLEPVLTDLNKTLWVTKMQFVVIGSNWINIIDNTAIILTVTPVSVIHKKNNRDIPSCQCVLLQINITIQTCMGSLYLDRKHSFIMISFPTIWMNTISVRQMSTTQPTRNDTCPGNQIFGKCPRFARSYNAPFHLAKIIGSLLLGDILSIMVYLVICPHTYVYIFTNEDQSFLLINLMHFWQGLCIFQHKPCVTVNTFTPGWCGITFRSEISEHMLHTLNISELVKLLLNVWMISQHWFR